MKRTWIVVLACVALPAAAAWKSGRQPAGAVVAHARYNAGGWSVSGMTVEGTFADRAWDDLRVAQLRGTQKIHVRYEGRAATHLSLKHAATQAGKGFQTYIDVTVNGRALLRGYRVPGHGTPRGRGSEAVLPPPETWEIERLLQPGANTITIALGKSARTVYWLKEIQLTGPKAGTGGKGIKPVAVTDDEGRRVTLYAGSHALLIGVSDYTAGWPDLESIPAELAQVEKGFLRKALPMNQLLAWSRQMEATHALFLFDSCFSGTIFKTRALPATPPHISHATAKPVRQFITAGGAGQEVPAKSVFVRCFLRGLEGQADLTKDGYITGSEFGVYLRDRLQHYGTGQIPQYGKIRDPELDEGDFVFRLSAP